MTTLAPTTPVRPTAVVGRAQAPVTYEFHVVSPEQQTPRIVEVFSATWRHTLAVIAVALVAAQFLVLPLVQQRAQVAAARQLQQSFTMAAGAIGHSDLSALPNEPMAVGSAVASLEIPKLGVQQVVVEGATGSQTLAGPGHVSGSAGVGERGTSIVVGHRASAGAPFAGLGSLAVGDVIKTVTIAGPMEYRVTSVGNQLPELPASTGDRSQLVLVTGTPAGVALTDLVVTAESTKPAYASTPQNRLQGSGIRSIDAGAVAPTLASLLLLLGFITCARFWLRAGIMDRVLIWTVAAPVVALLGLLLTRSVAGLLPPTL
ncbi:MAG: sortase [Actinobacteria bacterium]|nr:sortase [Actinomycetota bacterium]